MILSFRPLDNYPTRPSKNNQLKEVGFGIWAYYWKVLNKLLAGELILIDRTKYSINYISSNFEIFSNFQKFEYEWMQLDEYI